MDQRKLAYLLELGYDRETIIAASFDRAEIEIPASFQPREVVAACDDTPVSFIEQRSPELRLASMDQRVRQYCRETLGMNDDEILAGGFDYFTMDTPGAFKSIVVAELIARQERDLLEEQRLGIGSSRDASTESTQFVERRSSTLRLRSMDPLAREYCRELLHLSDAQIIARGYDYLTFDPDVSGYLKPLTMQQRIELQAQSLASLTDEERYAEELDAAFDDVAPEVQSAAMLDGHYAATERRLVGQIGDFAGLLAEFKVVFVLIEDLDRPLGDRFVWATEEKINPLALPAAEFQLHWLRELPVNKELIFKHPRFKVWLRTRLGNLALPDANLDEMLQVVGERDDVLLREYLDMLDAARRGGLDGAFYPSMSMEQVSPVVEALRIWTAELDQEVARLEGLCEQAYQIERGAETRRGIHSAFGVQYKPPCICGARLELLAIAKQLRLASVDDFHYGNQLVAAYQAHQAAEAQLTSLNVRLVPVSVKQQLKRYRFTVMGWAKMEVEVEAHNLAEAKAKLKADDVISGDTPQTIHQRYLDEEYEEGESWCYDGIAAFWQAFEELTLDTPVFSTEFHSVLVVRELTERYEGPERTYRFELSLPNQVCYKATVIARHINEAIDQILALDVSFLVTEDSDPELYGSPEFDFDDNEENAGMFGMLTESQQGFRARLNGGTTRVGYEII
jgi:hypothetical protein